MAISLSKVSFAYEKIKRKEPRYVLKDVDLLIDTDKSDFITIIGHTGSGKSTLVQLFNGLLTPSEGEANIFGKIISSKKKAKLKEVRKREHYSKPGERRREAKKEAIKNSRRRERNYN